MCAAVEICLALKDSSRLLQQYKHTAVQTYQAAPAGNINTAGTHAAGVPTAGALQLQLLLLLRLVYFAGRLLAYLGHWA
jgi:hypothetical protein